MSHYLRPKFFQLAAVGSLIQRGYEAAGSNGRHVILGADPVRQDVKLQGADDADNPLGSKAGFKGFAALLGELLDCPFEVFTRIGSSGRTRCAVRGETGIPANRRSSPVKVSPMRKLPWLGMPMMSPGKASSANPGRGQKERVVDGHGFSRANMFHFHAALEMARANPRESHPVTVFRVHVG